MIKSKKFLIVLTLLLIFLLFGCGNNTVEGHSVNIGDYNGNKMILNILGDVRTYHYKGDELIVLDKDVFYINEDNPDNLADKLKEANKVDFPDRTYTVKENKIIIRDGQSCGQTYYIWKNGDKKKKRTGYFITNGSVTVKADGASAKIILPPSTAEEILSDKSVETIQSGTAYLCSETLEELKELYTYNGFTVTEADGGLRVEITKSAQDESVKMFNVKRFDDKVQFFIE